VPAVRIFFVMARVSTLYTPGTPCCASHSDMLITLMRLLGRNVMSRVTNPNAWIFADWLSTSLTP